METKEIQNTSNVVDGQMLDEYRPHLRIYYNMDILNETIEKCESYMEFYTEYPSLYIWVKKNDLTDYVKPKLPHLKKMDYTEEEILQVLSTCGKTKLSEVRKDKDLVKYYHQGLRMGLKDEMSNILIKSCVNRTKEECQQLALKFETIKDFKTHHSTIYHYIHNHGWSDELFKHMRKLGSKYKRAVYCYTFSDGCVYYGLTSDLDRRNIQHHETEDSAVYQYVKLTGEIPKYEIISEYIDTQKAGELERELILKSKEIGLCLNRNVGGGLGKLEQISREDLINDAKKYHYRIDWKKSNYSYYNIAVNRNQKEPGYLDSICLEAGLTYKDNTIWTETKIGDYIKDNNITIRTGKGGLKDLNQSAYRSAHRLGILDKLFPK